MKKLLTEAAKTIGDADSEKLAFMSYDSSDGKELILYRLNETSELEYDEETAEYELTDIDIFAAMTLTDPEVPAWSAYQVYTVAAEKGWGSFIYDIAMSKYGPIMSYREKKITPNARRIWFYYLLNRPDVQKLYLDDITNPKTKRIIDDSPVFAPKTKVNPLNYAYKMKNPIDISSLEQRHIESLKILNQEAEDAGMGMLSPGRYKTMEKEIYELATDYFKVRYSAISPEEKVLEPKRGWVQDYARQSMSREPLKELWQKLAGVL
jgi:hypothetical protein